MDKSDRVKLVSVKESSYNNETTSNIVKIYNNICHSILVTLFCFVLYIISGYFGYLVHFLFSYYLSNNKLSSKLYECSNILSACFLLQSLVALIFFLFVTFIYYLLKN